MPEGHTVHRNARQLVGPPGRGAAARVEPAGALRRRRRRAGRLGAGPGRGLGQAPAAALRRPARQRPLPPRPPGAVRHAGCSGTGEPPEPRGALRLRLVAGARAAGDGEDRPRGPTCAGRPRASSWTTPARAALLARLGPDPLRRDADPGAGVGPGAPLAAGRRRPAHGPVRRWPAWATSTAPRCCSAPASPRCCRARPSPQESWQHVWDDLVVLMRAGRPGRAHRHHRAASTGTG